MRTYEKYKDSGISWIGKVPEGWNKCRFKNFMTLITDASTSDNKIGLENIESGTGKYVQTDSEFEGNGIAFKPHDIVYGKLRPYLQKVWCAEFEGNAVGDFFVFRNKCNSTSSFLKYLLLSDNFTQFANGTTYGAKMPRVSSNAILDQEFYIPSLSEQEAIANYLDKKTAEIDKIIAEREKKIELLNELKSSIISRAVTKGINPHAKMKDSGIDWIGEIPEDWELMKIKQIALPGKGSIKTGPFGTQLKGDDLKTEGEVCVYNQRNVIDNNFNDIHFWVSKEKANSLSGFYTRPYDLLITSRGTIGKCALLSPKFPMGILHPCLIALRINTHISLYDWVRMFIQYSNSFKEDICLKSNATTIDVIYSDTLKNVFIPVPPLEIQDKIIKHIRNEFSNIDNIVSKIGSEISLLREYKQSLISEVVTGKRKVID